MLERDKVGFSGLEAGQVSSKPVDDVHGHVISNPGDVWMAGVSRPAAQPPAYAGLLSDDRRTPDRCAGIWDQPPVLISDHRRPMPRRRSPNLHFLVRVVAGLTLVGVHPSLVLWS